jgi:hypothetical protein
MTKQSEKLDSPSTWMGFEAIENYGEEVGGRKDEQMYAIGAEDSSWLENLGHDVSITVEFVSIFQGSKSKLMSSVAKGLKLVMKRSSIHLSPPHSKISVS